MLFFWGEKHSVKHLELNNLPVLSLTSGFFLVYLCLSLVDHALPANCCTTILPWNESQSLLASNDEAAKPFDFLKAATKKGGVFLS